MPWRSAAFACMNRNKKPITPARSEADKMPIFASAMSTASGKARFATKMAMVKPTPPRMPAPSIWIQLT